LYLACGSDIAGSRSGLCMERVAGSGGPEQDTSTRLTDLTGVTEITKDGNYLNRKLMWL
jgi:hypothetical protein